MLDLTSTSAAAQRVRTPVEDRMLDQTTFRRLHKWRRLATSTILFMTGSMRTPNANRNPWIFSNEAIDNGTEFSVDPLTAIIAALVNVKDAVLYRAKAAKTEWSRRYPITKPGKLERSFVAIC